MTSTFFNKLMQRPMDRKTFVKTLLLGAALMTGLAGVVRVFGADKSSAGSKYGSSAYGGTSKQ